MNAATPPPGDDAFVWDADLSRTPAGSSPPADDDEPETYKIPGGLSGWIPGEIPPPNSDGTLRKSPGREEPKVPAAPTARRPKRAKGNNALALMGFNLMVFVGSVCVMTLELTASRLIAKHVGSSLYTWTSVIGVVLAGITLGNYLGGYLADRFSRPRTLSWMFFLSSLSCASVLWLDQIVSGMARPGHISWPTWILCVVAMMFLLPALLLGTTSPLIASMALERGTKTGSTVGNVYAWGAFGSIIGTFLTGFYLIDVWGTRSIIGMTAATLALLAVAVASGRWAFRTAVLVGWMQFLAFLWMASTITGPSAEALAGRCRSALALGADAKLDAVTPDGKPKELSPNEREAANSARDAIRGWERFGNNVGDNLHELGLLLQLRDDQTDAYHDESSYSYIQVRDDYVEGVPVRALRLDKLDHSYFDPAEPTKLHYEYEEVYAAITHRAAPSGPQQVQTQVPPFPGRDELVSRLPAGVTFDAKSGLLTVEAPDPATLKSLRELSRDANYWNAVEDLHRETTLPNWGGFSTVNLPELPAGVAIPDDLQLKIRHDANLQALLAYEAVTVADRDRLLGLGSQAPWRLAVDGFRQQSAPISTLFIGGGGFIFPRWVLAEFPAAAHVDVAELDPAVYFAVRQEMGLSADEAQRIHTVLGDARNFVDDRLRANQTSLAKGEDGVSYDFIYGDAFNDFSVPWHLTTKEFTQKVHDLLTPRGVFLANIIEIYPRTEIPGGTARECMAELHSPPPEKLFNTPQAGVETQVRAEFAPLQHVGGSHLHFTGEMSRPFEERLVKLAEDDADWQRAVHSLADRSRNPQPLTMPVPEELMPELTFEHEWKACPEPFLGVEVYRLPDDKFLLGLRGSTPEPLRQRLLDLQPENRDWQTLVDSAVERSRRVEPGRFLGRYVATMTTVFPYVAVFCTSDSQPSEIRDTFVVACARVPLDLTNLSTNAPWEITPFAEYVKLNESASPELKGQMGSILELADGHILTDDFAPVDNLLRPVFVDQDE